jgi:hypothetical protein
VLNTLRIGQVYLGLTLSHVTLKMAVNKLHANFEILLLKTLCAAEFPYKLTKWHALFCIYCITAKPLTFGHRSFTFNSNKSPTWCNNFSVYYRDVCLQLNMFRAFSRLISGAQWLQWQPLVLPSYRGDSRVVFVVGSAGRPAGPTTTNNAATTTLQVKTKGC